MNIYNEIHQPTLPDFELIRPNAVTHLPHSVECGSRWRTYGSSSGWSTDVARCAIGEHFERKHFYLDIPVHDTNRLDDGLTPREFEEYAKAFSQTSISNTSTSLQSHLFDRTNVYRVTNFTRCKIPTICLSISECRNVVDNQFYPMRDTCGCSAHITVDDAVLGALKETLERQFLLRFWLTKSCLQIIGYNEACASLAGRSSLTLFQELNKSGELCILDLTDNRFPGACILLCYGNKQPGAIVKYCAGMAYATDLSAALEKSIVELWQTFRYMQSFESDHDNKQNMQDPYLKHFLACNQYNTYQGITTNIQARTQKIGPATQLTTQRLLDTVRELNLNGYLYLSHIPIKNSNLYFCKYSSPNLFLHMNNASHLNIKNTYSSPFFNNIITSQLSKMVPFP